MKSSIRIVSYLFFAFIAILSCTKDIGLKTEVEFSLIEQHNSEGHINEQLPTTVTVVPEAELEGFSYGYSYTVAQGEGYFIDEEGKVLSQNERRKLDPFSASMMYVGAKEGAHLIRVTATDNFGFTKEVDIDYLLTKIPVVWTATSPVSRMELGNSATITVTFETADSNLGRSYERNYSLTNGSGTLTEQPTATEVNLAEFEPISPGSYLLTFTPDALGNHQLSFDLKDDTGKELKAVVNFEVLKEIIDTIAPEITLLGDNPITVVMGSNYKDPGATATDDVDGDISQNIIIDAANVNMTKAGTYQVAYNVSDAAGNAAVEVTRTVNVVAGEVSPNAILAFAIPGQVKASVIDTNAHTVTVDVPFGTELNVVPLVLTVSPNATILPSPSAQVNFKDPFIYTVTSENGSQQEWTVTVNPGASIEKSIERFTIAGVDGTISQAMGTIMLTLPAGNDATALVPQIEFTGASILPTSGSSVDFTDPVRYTVTAEDGSRREYTVTVIVEKSGEKEITAFGVAGVAGVFSGTDNTDITITLPAGNDEKSLSPSIVHTGETISPQSGTAQNFTNSVMYTVTAEDSSEKTYNVTVIVQNDAPVAVASASTTTATINQAIDFTGSSSTDDTGINTYSWNFGDGSTSTIANPVHSYTAHGDYNVTLTVTDDNGLTDTTRISVSVPNLPPMAVASASITSARPNVPITFTGNNSTDDLGISTYAWDFGDGRNANTANTSHAFSCAGNYTVSLTVTDAGGLTDTETIQISIPAPTAVSYDPTESYLYGPPGTTITVQMTLNTQGFSNFTTGTEIRSLCYTTTPSATCPYNRTESISAEIPSCGRLRIQGSTTSSSTMIIIGVDTYQLSQGNGLPR